MDVADVEVTSHIPPFERRLYELDLFQDEFIPMYENQNTVKNTLTENIDLLLCTKTFPFKNKMLLTDLYYPIIRELNVNSSLIYGQLKLILKSTNEQFCCS